MLWMTESSFRLYPLTSANESGANKNAGLKPKRMWLKPDILKTSNPSAKADGNSIGFQGYIFNNLV